jgi:hypothetical protein
MDKEIEIEDLSGDRKYFTMLPNYILNHSTAIDQALYMQMKKVAGENGRCFLSERTLMEKLGVGEKSLKKSINYLLKRGWIKENGFVGAQTLGGIQKVKAYRILDIWKYNIQHYEGASESVPLGASESSKVLSKGAQGASESGTNKNHTNKNHRDTRSSIEYLKFIPQEDIQEFVARFDMSENSLKSKAEDLILYCQSKGRKYTDYRAFLLNALKKDFKPRQKSTQIETVTQKELTPELREKANQARLEINRVLFKK